MCIISIVEGNFFCFACSDCFLLCQTDDHVLLVMIASCCVRVPSLWKTDSNDDVLPVIITFCGIRVPGCWQTDEHVLLVMITSCSVRVPSFWQMDNNDVLPVIVTIAASCIRAPSRGQTVMKMFYLSWSSFAASRWQVIDRHQWWCFTCNGVPSC